MLEFLQAIPFGTRWLMLMMIILYLLQFLVLDETFLGYVTINPYYVCEKFQFWRLITSIFFHTGIVHLIMNMMTFYQLGVSFERTIGTFSFYFHIIVFGLISNLLYLFVAWFMKFGGRPETYYGSAVGFSGVLFSLTVIDNKMTGGAKRSVLGLFLVPTEIYPWVMLLFMSLIMPNVSLVGHATGLVIGYLYTMGLLKWLSPSPEFCSRLERKLCCCCIHSSGYIAADGPRETWQPRALFDGFDEQQDNNADQNDEHVLNRPGNTQNAFQGTPRTIGGGPGRTNNTNNNNQNNNGPFIGRPHTIGEVRNTLEP